MQESEHLYRTLAAALCKYLSTSCAQYSVAAKKNTLNLSLGGFQNRGDYQIVVTEQS